MKQSLEFCPEKNYMQIPLKKKPSNESSPNPNKRKHEENHTQRKKLKTDMNERQLNYNTKMKESRSKALKFHADEFVCIKIDRVDKTLPLYPNDLIGKIIEVEDDYAKIVTKPFGRLKTCISMNRLNKCTTTNINLDYTKEIMFSGC